MESRSTGSPGEKRKSQSGLHQPLISNIVPNEQIKEFLCPVTTDVFFEPVMLSGCGHLVEGRIASTLRKCPVCRGAEQAGGISIIAAPPIVTSILANTLTADPSLWQKVYLDHAYLAEVLSKGAKNPTFERFIKLLENNSEENLNEQPRIERPGELPQKGKSAIEVLASFYAGRELLRHNEKIQALISAETKLLSVNGKTIDEWIKTEEEKPAPIPAASVSGVSFFASSSPSSSSSNPAAQALPQPPDTVCQRVVYGNEEGVLQMIQADHRLVEQKQTVMDYSGRIVDDATPFQAALRAGDDVMAKKIKAIYLAANPDHGQAELDAQFNEVFRRGYDTHLQEQKQSADTFERDYLNPLVDAFDNAAIADLRMALEKRDNGSVLYRKLNEFKAAFHELSLREKVYNPNHLLKTFEKYNAKFGVWYGNVSDDPHRWLRLDLFWRQVIGWEGRDMTTNYAQSFCTGLDNIIEGNQPLQRILSFHNYATGRGGNFFPLDLDPSSRLGSDFAVDSYCGAGRWRAVGPAGGLPFPGSLLQNLCRAKTAGVGELCSPNRIIVGTRP